MNDYSTSRAPTADPHCGRWGHLHELPTIRPSDGWEKSGFWRNYLALFGLESRRALANAQLAATPVYIDFLRLVLDKFGFKGDFMFRPIVVALSALILCVGLAYDGTAQQAPSSASQPPGGRGRVPDPPPPPPLFFRETWQLMGPPHAIATEEVVVSNTNLELKMYGPSAMAPDPDKRIWISGLPVLSTSGPACVRRRSPQLCATKTTMWT